MKAAVLKLCLIAALIELYECRTCKKCLLVTGLQPNATVPDHHHSDCEGATDNVQVETCEGTDTCATKFWEDIVTVHNEAKNITMTADINVISRSCSMFPKPAVLPDTECGYTFNASVTEQTVVEILEARNLTLLKIEVKKGTTCQCFTDNCNTHKMPLNSATTPQGALFGFILNLILLYAL